MDVSLICC